MIHATLTTYLNREMHPALMTGLAARIRVQTYARARGIGDDSDGLLPIHELPLLDDVQPIVLVFPADGHRKSVRLLPRRTPEAPHVVVLASLFVPEDSTGPVLLKRRRQMDV